MTQGGPYPNYEHHYLMLLREILDRGDRQKNRTGVDTFYLPGAMLQIDLRNGYPLLTTKQMAYKQIFGELCGFIRGFDNAAKFREFGCKIWDANANQNQTWLNSGWRQGEDDLGRIYGVQWRNWTFDNESRVGMDQLEKLLLGIYHDPTSRRLIVTAWRPDEIAQMALPPCHLLFQVLIGQKDHSMNMCIYMRSCDMFLGVPFNIASYAALLSLLATLTGYTPGVLTMFLADAHIYENHVEQVELQLKREPRQPPRLFLGIADHEPIPMPPQGSAVEALMILNKIIPEWFNVHDYDPYPPIKAPMAV